MYRILIVDDERNERTGIEKLIRRYQFHLEVVQASNGREALEKFEQNGIDILLTDIKMPLMSGIELIKEVHKRGWDPICIIYSAYGEFEYAQNAIALGVMQYLLKPIKMQEFQNLFEHVVSLCEEKDHQQVESEALKIKLRNVENDKMYRQLLKYLESEAAERSEDTEELFARESLVPVILSSYSYLFSRYWENYEEDINKIFDNNPVIINKDDTQTLVLAGCGRLSSQRKREEVCERLIQMSRDNFQSEIFIVMGTKCSSMEELKTQYEIMRDQLDYQFFITESTYFLIEESGFVKKESDMLSIYFKKILTSAKLKDFQGIKSEFEKAFEYVEKNVGFSSIYIKYNFSEVIKQCCEILHSGERLMEVVEDIYGSRSITQVKQAVSHLIDVLAEDERIQNEENRVVIMAKTYIHEHYKDCTLSVSSIADELGISSAYLSTQFKAETGQQLVKYISWYRIERARDLLTTTNVKVGEVAKKVGYLNTSYFISLFRNNMGCSPAKYRERAFKDEG